MLLKQCRFKLLQMKTLSMMFGVSMFDDRSHVFFGRISHIPFPTILWMFNRQLPHMLVPICLCENRGSRNARKLCISFNHAFIRISVKRLESIAVNQEEFRFYD